MDQAQRKQEKQDRQQECAKALAELLTQFDCDLVARPQIAPDGRIIATVQLVAK